MALPVNKVVRVLVLVRGEDENEEADWTRLGLEQFFAGYSDADSIYDDL